MLDGIELPKPTQGDTRTSQIWSVEDVGDVGIGYFGTGVCIMNVCCANRSLTVTAGEARQFAAALLAAADASDKVDSDA